MNALIITPREILIEALRCLAVGMVLVHNHPSGDPQPSQSDLLLTRRVKEGRSLVGVILLDHIVIGDKRLCELSPERPALERIATVRNG